MGAVNVMARKPHNTILCYNIINYKVMCSHNTTCPPHCGNWKRQCSLSKRRNSMKRKKYAGMLEFCPSFCPNKGKEKIAEGWEGDAAGPGIHAGLNDVVFLLKGREKAVCLGGVCVYWKAPKGRKWRKIFRGWKVSWVLFFFRTLLVEIDWVGLLSCRNDGVTTTAHQVGDEWENTLKERSMFILDKKIVGQIVI